MALAQAVYVRAVERQGAAIPTHRPQTNLITFRIDGVSDGDDALREALAIQEELHKKASETLEQRAADAKAAKPELNVRCALRDGDPHDETMACATEESADMIVMGTHGHTGITHALLGSTAEKVVRLASCPVLTVRSTD